MFVEGLRRDGKIIEAGSSAIIKTNDVLAIGGDHDAVIALFQNDLCYTEVDDRDLLGQPVAGVDVYVSSM